MDGMGNTNFKYFENVQRTKIFNFGNQKSSIWEYLHFAAILPRILPKINCRVVQQSQYLQFSALIISI